MTGKGRVRPGPVVALALAVAAIPVNGADEEFDQFLRPLFARSCTKCHGDGKVKGKVNLYEIATVDELRGKPALIEEVIEVVDARDMPPGDEPELREEERVRLVAVLKAMLREAAGEDAAQRARMRRLNRFQYNNAVVDLFRMNRDVFALQEKLMTRHGSYLAAGVERMPERVEAECRSLRTEGGMEGVQPFPKDLRAAHGYDNQANQLTLSPLLLDSFLRLSVSIVESPDFNPETVGVWGEFFAEPPEGIDRRGEIRRRLAPFLMQAFRSEIENETLDRYAAYAVAKMEEGLSFTQSMKKVASAVLSSPRFLFRRGATADGEDLFVVASNLSFFLWGSGPDAELLRLASSGELAGPEVFRAAVERMMDDPKIERFLDTFPSQWMQLENVLGATPDPDKARLFSLDPSFPAGLQMVLEPLLLFDAVFVEDRPITELIAPRFAYRSEFLNAWYAGTLQPPQIDPGPIREANRARDAQRAELQTRIAAARTDLEALIDPVRERLAMERRERAGSATAPDLRPFAAWEFNGNLRESVRGLDLTAQGPVRFDDGMVVLEKGAYLQSKPLPIDLKAKTLEVWCLVHDVNQRGGGVMGIQGPGDFFDTIVLGERKPRHWISGSNGFSRTLDFAESTPEAAPRQRLHLAMVYEADGTTTLYRNGVPYGKPYRKGAATFPREKSSMLFGLRHLPPGGNKHLGVSIGRARLYDRALNAEEVAASGQGHLYVSEEELAAAMTPEQRMQRAKLDGTLAEAEAALGRIPPNQDPEQLQKDALQRFDDEVRQSLRSTVFERVAVDDPRYGGVITNAAVLSMTSGPDRTHPIARGAWVIEVIFNDPPPPPPNDVPPLPDDSSDAHLTVREKFARHRENPDCAGCHSRLDPLGFALENYDLVGRWRDNYENGREVDASGTLMKKHAFDGAVRFKKILLEEEERFAQALAAHLLRFALARELSPRDSLTVDAIVARAKSEDLRLRALIREVILSESFLPSN